MSAQSSDSNDEGIEDEEIDEFSSQSSSGSSQQTPPYERHRHSQFTGPVSAIKYHQLDLRGSEDDIQLSSSTRRRQSALSGAMVRHSRLHYTSNDRAGGLDRLKASVNKVIAANRMYRFHEEEEFNEYSYVEGEEVGEEVESDWLEVANHMDTAIPKQVYDVLESVTAHILSTKAQSFANQHLCHITSTLLDSSPFQFGKAKDKFGMTEEEYVDKSIRMALRIINQDLRINGSQPNGRCKTIAVLQNILDRSNAYYAEADEPEDVRFDKLLAFQRINGFRNLGVYFAARCNDDNKNNNSSNNDINDNDTIFPNDWNFVSLALRSCYEGIVFLRLHLNDEVINGSRELLRKHQEDSKTLVKTVMMHLTQLNPDNLANVSLKKLTKVLAAIKDLYLEYAMSDDDAMAEYFAFLQEIIVKLFSTTSIPHKQFGVDLLHTLIQSIYGTMSIPKAYTVSGAGFEMVNGTYCLSPTITNDKGFVISGANPQYETVDDVTGKKFVLIVSSVAEGKMESLSEDQDEENAIPYEYTDYWSLSEEHEENTIPYVYTDYYVAVAEDSRRGKTPCLSGWTFIDECDDPPPRLEASSDMVQFHEDHCSLKKNFALWFLQNNVLNYVLDTEGSASTDASSVSMLVEALDTYFEDSSGCLSFNMSNLMVTILPHLRNSEVKCTQLSTSNDATIEAAKQRLASAKRWQQNASRMLLDAQTEHSSSTVELKEARAAVKELETLLSQTSTTDVPKAASKSKGRRRGSISTQKPVDKSIGEVSLKGGRNRRRSLELSSAELPFK